MAEDNATTETTETAAPAESPAATHPPEALRMGLPDGPESLPGKPFEKGQGTVTVRTRWPVDSFDHGVKGVPVITAQGVEVDRKHAAKLNVLAAESGIELEETE